MIHIHNVRFFSSKTNNFIYASFTTTGNISQSGYRMNFVDRDGTTVTYVSKGPKETDAGVRHVRDAIHIRVCIQDYRQLGLITHNTDCISYSTTVGRQI